MTSDLLALAEHLSKRGVEPLRASHHDLAGHLAELASADGDRPARSPATLQRKAASVPGAPLAPDGALLARVTELVAALGEAETARAGQGEAAQARTAHVGRTAGALLWAVSDLVRRRGAEPEEALRAAARVAGARGAPQSAARYLGRALTEPPERSVRAMITPLSDTTLVRITSV